MTNDILTPSRRRFLQALGGGALATLPALSLPGFVSAAGAAPEGDNILVLIELSGGNDGLNTVVPVTDSAYRGLRPTIGLGRRDTLQLDRDTGLHGAMIHMADLWHDGSLQIVEGVGYPNPNRSHFRSIEIWNSGQGADSRAHQGWVASAFDGGRAHGDADGLALGGDLGPLRGPGRFAVIPDEDQLADTLGLLQMPGHAVRPGAGQSPLDQVLATYDSAAVTGDRILTRLDRSSARQFGFPDTELGAQLRTATRLLEAGVGVPVLKVEQGGYDTHETQPDMHAFLLAELSEAVGAFARAMKEIGLWDRVTVVTYSEFGRTARENGSAGTDHGTAAPLFVAGGKVQGGFGGARVRLDRLVEDDLVHTTDYRAVYKALLTDLWGIDAPMFQTTSAPLRLLRT